MRINNIIFTYLALIALAFGGGAWAQEAPLSVIDWLKRHPDQPPMTSAILPERFEPPVSPNALAPEIITRPLEQRAPQIIGLVPASVTGLPESLWAGSNAQGLSVQLADLRPMQLPAAQALLYTVLLTEAAGPGLDPNGEDTLSLARVEALIRLGAPDPALALLRQTNFAANPELFAAFMDAALLTGEEDTACAVLALNPHLAPTLGHRIFCSARQGDWPTAALLFDTGNMLGEMPTEQARALERFLHPDSYDDLPPLDRPGYMTPLLFRLHESIGEPMPTGSLPLAYAVADLRDLAGWKTQLDAAERLAVAGALPANRLLGLYTARRPAASGSVWDRVRAIQNVETALRARSLDAITKTLPAAWSAMQDAGLELVFAELFAEPLARYDLSGQAAKIARKMALLSPEYRRLSARDTNSDVLAAVARGNPSTAFAQETRTAALLAGFDDANARRDLMGLARNGRMGEAILRALVLLDDGASGDPLALSQGLATLRAFGLEDTARRAALQILLLERYS